MLANICSMMSGTSFVNLLTSSKRIYKKDTFVLEALKVRPDLVNSLFEGTIESLPRIFQNPRVLASTKALDFSDLDLQDVSLPQVLGPFTGLQELDLSQVEGLHRKDFLSLKPFPNLREFILDGEEELDDKALGHITKMMPNLRILSLKECWRITAKGVQQLASLKQLEELDLENVHNIDDEAFHILATNLTNLRKLDIQDCTHITNVGYRSLVYLQELREIDFYCEGMGNSQDDDFVQFVVQLPHLEKLNFYCSHDITFKGFCLLSSLKQPELFELILGGMAIDDESLDHIAKNLTNLRKLDISDCYQLTSHGYQAVAFLKDLRELDVSDSEASEEGYEHGVDDDALRKIAQLSHLEELNLGYCKKITPKGFEVLASLKNLRVLHLSGTNVDDESLRYIALHLPYLRVLHLDSESITFKGIESLASLQSLEKLGLNLYRKDDQFLRAVAMLPNVHSIREHETQLARVNQIRLEKGLTPFQYWSYGDN